MLAVCFACAGVKLIIRRESHTVVQAVRCPCFQRGIAVIGRSFRERGPPTWKPDASANHSAIDGALPEKKRILCWHNAAESHPAPSPMGTAAETRGGNRLSGVIKLGVVSLLIMLLFWAAEPGGEASVCLFSFAPSVAPESP